MYYVRYRDIYGIHRALVGARNLEHARNIIRAWNATGNDIEFIVVNNCYGKIYELESVSDL